MKLSIVLSTQPASFSALAYKGELDTNIAKIAGLAYDGVELAVRDPALLNVTHIQKVVSENRLVVPAIGTGQAYGEEGLSFTDPDATVRKRAIDRIKTQVALAERFGAVVILGLIRGKIVDGVAKNVVYDWMVQALQECAEEAERKNVRLAMEPINRYETDLIQTVADGLKLIEQVGSEQFGLLLDTFHMNIEEPSIIDSIRAAADHIFHFHVADSNRWYPGAGHIDFRQVVAVMREVGYNGFLSAEILPKPDPDICARETVRHMRSVLKP